MIRCLRFELRRAFESVGMKISILLGCIIVIVDLVTFYALYGKYGGKVLIQGWIGTDYIFAYNALFYIVFPILACLPYAGSHYQDIFRRYDKNICIRVTGKQYKLSKCVAVYISAFVCITFPLLLNLFISAGIYPDNLPVRLEFMNAGILDRHRFAVLFCEYPLAYCLVFIIIDGLFAGIFALVSIAVARICKSHFSAVMTPFVIYILTSMFLLNDSGFSIALMEMINPVQRYITTTGQMISIYILIMVVTSMILFFVERKRDIL